MAAQHTPGPQIVKQDVRHPGIYASVNLNGFTLASHAKPPAHKSVILGYRVPHLPEVWFGMGYRDPVRHGAQCWDRYWLGATGLEPNYHALNDDQVVMWREVEMPFQFDEGRGTSSYLQYRYVVGEAPWETEEDSKRERAIAIATGSNHG